MLAFDELQKVPRSVEPDYFIDDFTMAAMGSYRTVIKDLVHFAENLRAVIVEELEASIALDKAAVVASSRKLARALRKLLQELAGKLTSAAKNLGIDFIAGKAWLDGRRPYAGVHKAMLRHESTKFLQGIEKVKAHVVEPGEEHSIKDAQLREKIIEKSCPLWGQKGHTTGGKCHKPAASVHFNPFDFKVG